jgi:NosR/NirI family nitrous oxide reductase transcriptional regulator
MRKALQSRADTGFGRCGRQLVAFMLALMLAGVLAPGDAAAEHLSEFLAKVLPSDFFAGAERFDAPQGDPPIVPVRRADQLLGFVYLNSDFTSSVGYSGKPMHVLVGIDTAGVITGLKLVEHSEPIVLIGIPEARIVAALNSLVGKNMRPVARGVERPPQVDIVSGATVTVVVLADSVVRSAVRLLRSGRIAGGEQAAAAPAPAQRELDLERSEVRSWDSLIADGSIRRLHLTVSEVSAAFERAGKPVAAANTESADPNDTFIDLYVALATVPTIGRSLLGEAAYRQLLQRLKPRQQAIIIAGEGAYSFKGSGYVRGGIFDRIQVVQDGSTVRFRDRDHTRLAELAAEGAPDLKEIALFVVPDSFTLDPVAEWQTELLVQRPVGARDKAFLTFELDYQLPAAYTRLASPAAASPASAQPGEPAAAPAQNPATSSANRTQPEGQRDLVEEPLWQRIWRGNIAAIVVTAVALGLLTVVFFFQSFFVRRPRLLLWLRAGFLAFTLVWLGWIENAQLSVVNVITFVNALVTGFRWEYFLAAPLIFILWSSIAAALLFWGRGPFCGWLCPFGALQELLNKAAQWAGVPQLRIPWAVHERLWPFKYIIFLVLFGFSLHSIPLAEQLAEVEPFKTTIILKFARGGPFVLYALGLLAIGLFVERFFCRYLCPLGAALAIPARLRTFEWLKRWPECGSPCHRCARECPVQSIHPEGHINVSECIYCMHCQELYFDDQRCPHMAQLRLKRERWAGKRVPTSPVASSRTSQLEKGPKRPIVTVNGKPVEAEVAADLPVPST